MSRNPPESPWALTVERDFIPFTAALSAPIVRAEAEIDQRVKALYGV